MSSNGPTVTQAAVQDAARVAAESIDVSNLTEAEARKLVSEEHKALGYRPPKGSLAATARSIIDKTGGDESEHHDVAKVKEAALQDAASVAIERQEPVPERSVKAGLDLNQIGEVEARKLMSDEHKALGHRPPHGSLAAEAQSAAAKHPHAGKDSLSELTEEERQKLARAALLDAARIEAEREGKKGGKVNVDELTEDQVKQLQSEERKILGTTKGTLAAEAQSIQSKN